MNRRTIKVRLNYELSRSQDINSPHRVLYISFHNSSENSAVRHGMIVECLVSVYRVVFLLNVIPWRGDVFL